MTEFAAYSHAIASLGLWAILSIILSGVSLRGRTPEGRCDCGKPKRDYTDRVYRADRAFMNAVENSGPFVAATVAAMLAGAAPFWVNVFASVFLVSRIAMAIVHIGTENQPLRSAMFVIGWVCMIALALMAVVAAI
jgi:uncharacterized MAPEG superfamily protein